MTTLSEIRAALRRNVVAEVAKITVTMPDGSTATPRVVAHKIEEPKVRDFPMAVVETPVGEYGDHADFLEYHHAEVRVCITCLIGAGGSEDDNTEHLAGKILDALDEGFLAPLEKQLSLALGIHTDAADDSPLCLVNFPQFVKVEQDAYGLGKDAFAGAKLTMTYSVEAKYERVTGGLPDDDFNTLAGSIDAGEPEAAHQVQFETQQP